MSLKRVLQVFLAWVAVTIAVAIAVASFPDGQAWLQSLFLWHQHDVAAVGQTGSNGAAYNRLGNEAESAGNDTAAINAYLQGETADPLFVWNFVALGWTYARLNRFAAADAQFRQAIRLAPRTQFLHYDLATVEMHEARYAAALRDFDVEAQISPKYQPAVRGRRQALEAMHAEGGRVAAALPIPTGVRSAAPSPSPTPAPTPTRPSTPTPAATRLAAAPLPSGRHATPSAGTSATPRQEIALVHGSQRSTREIQPQTPAPLLLSPSVATEARAYLLDVSQDLDFTQALPPADPNMTTADLRQKLQALTRSPERSDDEMLRLGAAALLSGHLSLAATAFSAAANQAKDDWRGPYLAGLAARAGGDDKGARTFFKEANARVARPEAYTSLAIVDLALGDDAAASADAEQAASMNPSYGPGRFTAGMVALVHNEIVTAQRHLYAASNLSGVPARSAYFLRLVSSR